MAIFAPDERLPSFATLITSNFNIKIITSYFWLSMNKCQFLIKFHTSKLEFPPHGCCWPSPSWGGASGHSTCGSTAGKSFSPGEVLRCQKKLIRYSHLYGCPQLILTLLQLLLQALHLVAQHAHQHLRLVGRERAGHGFRRRRSKSMMVFQICPPASPNCPCTVAGVGGTVRRTWP